MNLYQISVNKSTLEACLYFDCIGEQVTVPVEIEKVSSILAILKTEIKMTEDALSIYYSFN